MLQQNGSRRSNFRKVSFKILIQNKKLPNYDTADVIVRGNRPTKSRRFFLESEQENTFCHQMVKLHFILRQKLTSLIVTDIKLKNKP